MYRNANVTPHSIDSFPKCGLNNCFQMVLKKHRLQPSFISTSVSGYFAKHNLTNAYNKIKTLHYASYQDNPNPKPGGCARGIE